jgi:hypothetical protein
MRRFCGQSNDCILCNEHKRCNECDK